MSYKILFDYGAYEGLKFHEDEFETVNNAVKSALELNYTQRFLIVQIIDWEARKKDEDE